MATRGFLIGTVYGQPPQSNLVECSTYVSTDSDYLQTADTSLSIGDVWTIAFWQKRTVGGQASDRHIFHATQANTVSGRILYAQREDDTCVLEVRSDAGGSALARTINNLDEAGSLTSWEHVAFVYNANGGSADTVSTYVNGVNITSKTTSIGVGDPSIGNLANGSPNQTDIARTMTIGANRGGGSEWQGQIYNLGMWDTELTDAEILSLYNNGAGNEVDLREENGSYTSYPDLQHYWRFANSDDRGEDLGVAPLDLLDSDSGSHSFVTDDCPEEFNPTPANQENSLLYDETFSLTTNSTDTVGIDPSSGSTYTFSFACWAKYSGPSDSGRDHLIAVRQQSGAASALDFGLDDNSDTDINVAFVNGAQALRQFTTWTNVVTPGAWHHFVVTWDGTTGTGGDPGGVHLYVDGVNVDSGNRTAAINNDGSGFTDPVRNIHVGGRTGTGEIWEGPIFNASIYNSALSAAEVTELYASGNGQTVDPRYNVGNYVSADDLIHFYQVGHGVNEVGFGRDWTLVGTPMPLISLQTATIADLTSDIPD